MKNKFAVIILAAGKGERMKSSTPKVLHKICGRPMIEYVLDLVKGARAAQAVVVLGFKHEIVRRRIGPAVKIAIQKKMLGTADALKSGLRALKGSQETVVVLYGDIPLLTKETLDKLIGHHLKNRPDATILVSEVNNPKGYGRIMRDKYASICGIVEEKDADDFQKEIKEVNTGIICFSKDKLKSCIGEIKPNNKKKEFYLTDIIHIFYKKGYIIDGIKLTDFEEALGINSGVELARANSIMQKRINERLMKDGAVIIDPASAFISFGAKIGEGTVIYPFTIIEKDVKIGLRCSIGPFAHLREGTRVESDVVVGNFLEIVRSKLSPKILAKHFGYIGDSRIGKGVNIGAGTVTANFDGRCKSTTVIKEGAFIGSDTVLVAPVKVGRNAVTGAGSVVVKNSNIPDNTVVVGVPAKRIKKNR